MKLRSTPQSEDALMIMSLIVSSPQIENSYPNSYPPPLHMARTWMDMHRLRRLHDSQYIMKNPFTNENSNLSNIFHNNIHRKKVESLKVRSTEEFLCQFAWLPCRFFRGRRQGRQPLNKQYREGGRELYIYMWFTICRYIIPYTESYIYKWYVYEYYIGMRACIALFFQKNVVKYDQYRRMFCGNHQDMYLDHNWRNRQQNWYNIPKWVVVWGVSRSSISATVWAKTHTGWWFQPRFKVSVSWDHPSKIFQIGLNNGEHEKMKPPTRHIVYTVYTNKLFLSSPSMPSPPLFH